MQTEAPNSPEPDHQGRVSLWPRQLFLLVVFLVALRFLPPFWCEHGAAVWWEGDAGSQADLGRSVERWINRPLGLDQFLTGSETFDGEWLFGTYQMAVLGYAQLAEQHPELRAECLRRMEFAEDRILSDEVRKFDRSEWKEDPIESLDGPNGHAGYLAYFNLALSAHRRLDAGFKHRALHDRISTALARRLAASRIGLIETYPSQTYPVDNCAVAASLRLHYLADGTNRFQEVYGLWLTGMKQRLVDRRTGLLIQAVGSRTGNATDAPRGSGTLLGAYLLGVAGEPFAKDLYLAARRELLAPVMGFGAVREYPGGIIAGPGDIDSGPLIFGRSISASGFMLGCARQHGDEETFRLLYRSVHLFGAPTRQPGKRTFACGGPLGDSLLFALLTASPMETPEKGGRP